MIPDQDWNIIADKAFPVKTVKAPAFLWTRVLAFIEAEETRRTSTWWMQWRWMSRVTATVGAIIAIGIFFLAQQSTLPLDAALEGRSNQELALQVATMENSTPADSAGIVVGLDS